MANKLKVILGDCTLGVKTEKVSYIFLYAKGLESVKKDGKEMLNTFPVPTFWRGTTDNDKGCGFPKKSAMWYAADMFTYCSDAKVTINDKVIGKVIAPENNDFKLDENIEKVTISYSYQVPSELAPTVAINYTVDATGVLSTEMIYEGQEGLPELPVLGMKFQFPTVATGFTYSGLSGETYPDRKHGGEEGIYQVEGMPVAKYMMPQDCGVHVDTNWVEVSANDSTYKVTNTGEEMAFSCLPYTAQQIEIVRHHEEFPAPRFTNLNIYAKVRGVGGINSWGADVIDSCKIDGTKNYKLNFNIEFK